MDYFVLMRPTLFLPIWVFFILGAHFAGGALSWRSVLTFILYTLLMGGIYILNQIVDRESDKKNEKLFLLSDEIIPLSNAYLEMILLFIVSIGLSLFLGRVIFYFFLLSFFMGITYSLPKIEIKARPILDIIWNSIGYGFLSFGVGWLSVAALSGRMWLHGLPYLFAVSAVFVNTTIPDIKGDRVEGKITTGVLLGKQRTLILGIIFDVIAIIIACLINDPICLIAAGLSLPVFIYAAVRPKKKAILLSIRATSAILGIAVCVVTPLIIPVVILIYSVQKIYYRKKFNVDYPAIFSGADKEF
ncbi:UbiA family prenyltransferase [candidate division WOR-3 bacterium]|nr:UbiA family prenyltransferase [candidate division WOR-3 bacterium]